MTPGGQQTREGGFVNVRLTVRLGSQFTPLGAIWGLARPVYEDQPRIALLDRFM